MKKAVIGAGAFVVLAGGGMFAARAWLEGRLGKESLVAQMESSWNCRAQIENVSLVLMSSPARLEITGCIVAPRDAEAVKPLAQRTPLVAGKTGVSVGRAVLEVTLQDLLSRRLNIQQLTLSDVIVEEDVPKEGGSSLSLMFAGHEKAEDKVAMAATVSVADGAAPLAQPVSGAPAAAPPSEAPPVSGTSAVPAVTPAAKAADTPRTPNAGRKMKEQDHAQPSFVASQLGFSISVRSASIVRGSFHRDDHRATTKTDVTDLNFSISDIDVSPADLANHNSLKVALTGKWKQRGRIGSKEARREVVMADVIILGDGTIHPFDAATGEWKPVSELSLTMKEKSVLGGYMKLGETGSKDLKKLDDYGIDLRDLSLGGPLLSDANLLLTFEDDRLTLRQDARFAMPDFDLSLLKGSWLNGAEDEHEMPVRITCGPKLQEQVAGGVKKLLGDDLVPGIIKTLSDEKGRVYFDIRSSGRLSKPKAEFDLKRLLNRLLEGVGGGLLDGLIKKK